MSRSTRAGGGAYLGDLFHNCKPCRSVLSIPFGITLGSHQCSQLEKTETVFCIFGCLLCFLAGNKDPGKTVEQQGKLSVDLSVLFLHARVSSMQSTYMAKSAFYFIFLHGVITLDRKKTQ